jgi:hypothetical protein
MASGRVHTYYFIRHARRRARSDIVAGQGLRRRGPKKWDELHNKKPALVGTIEEAFAEWEAKVLPTYASAETRRGYTKNLRQLRKAFSKAGWAGTKMRHLVAYLEARKGKTQANRELSVFQRVWNYARIKGLTEVPWPAAGMERSKWKNEEGVREVEVTDAVFEAVYAQGDQLLKDAMDISSATGMRITDVRTVPLPPTDLLRLKASKTTKKADFDLSLSAVMPDVIARRRANKKAEHLMLLAGPFKRPVSYRQLHNRFVAARAAAAVKAEEATTASSPRRSGALWLRDCRKYAADLAEDAGEAQRLLQHGSMVTTMRHYRVPHRFRKNCSGVRLAQGRRVRRLARCEVGNRQQALVAVLVDEVHHVALDDPAAEVVLAAHHRACLAELVAKLRRDHRADPPERFTVHARRVPQGHRVRAIHGRERVLRLRAARPHREQRRDDQHDDHTNHARGGCLGADRATCARRFGCVRSWDGLQCLAHVHRVGAAGLVGGVDVVGFSGELSE